MSREGAPVLGIDAAGPVVGAALYSPMRERCWSARVGRGADGVLVPAVSELLAQADDPAGPWAGAGIAAVAVTVGPGTFTGLRVAVATALGVAVSRGAGVVALSSLEVRAAMVREERVLAVLDARKGRVYAGLFSVDEGGPRALCPERDVPPDRAWPEPPFWAVGEGAQVYSAAIEAAGGRIVPAPDRSPAREVARLGWSRRGVASDPAEVAIRYLRAPDARLPSGTGPG